MIGHLSDGTDNGIMTEAFDKSPLNTDIEPVAQTGIMEANAAESDAQADGVRVSSSASSSSSNHESKDTEKSGSLHNHHHHHHARKSYPEINSVPLGLAAFALTNLAVCLFMAQVHGITIPHAMLGLTCFYGGVIQFLAGCFVFVTGNTLAFTALISYAAFWLSLSAIFIDNFGVLSAYAETDQFNDALGFYFLGWALFSAVLFPTTLKSTFSFCGFFVAVLLEFILLAAGMFVNNLVVVRVGAAFGVVASVLSWYEAFSATSDQYNSYIHPYQIAIPVKKTV